jgi:hypothetical protein
MTHTLTIQDKLRMARLSYQLADRRARNPRTDPRLACEAEQERFRCAAIIADLEEKIQSARNETICKHEYPADLCGICNPVEND